jgi:hypothetical protein
VDTDGRRGTVCAVPDLPIYNTCTELVELNGFGCLQELFARLDDDTVNSKQRIERTK